MTKKTEKTRETKKTRKRWLFLSWSYSRRSEDIAAIFGIAYFCFPLSEKLRLIQFPLLFVKSFLFLLRKQPVVIFIQNPPVHSILPVALYSFVSGAHFIIDSHITPGTTLVEKPYHYLYLLLHRVYSYLAAVTLFHSRAILEKLKGWKCNCMVFENPVRRIEKGTNFPVKKRPSIGMISSFSPDEHLTDVIKAAKGLDGVSFYITGWKEKLPQRLKAQSPENVFFTGFIKGETYYEFLKAMDIVIVLTDRKESALLGAYESISAETPLVLSDTVTMRYYFPYGAVFVENTVLSIRNGIAMALREKESLKKEICKLKSEKLKIQEENLLKVILFTGNCFGNNTPLNLPVSPFEKGGL